MLKPFAAGLIGLALAVAPAAAANVSGWYAGIYGGGSNPGDIAFGLDNITAVLDGPGVIESPIGFANSGGVDPVLFDFLNQGLADFPFADLGDAIATLVDGTLDLRPGVTLGAVVGYGLGNGLRIEADLAGSSFASGDFTIISGTGQTAGGAIDGAGLWTWTKTAEASFPPPVPPPAPLEDMDFSYRSDVQFLLVNVLYDIDTGGAVTPYVGGGAGLARVTGTLTDLCLCGGGTYTQSALVPAGQLAGGLKVALDDTVSLDLGYRLKLAGDPSLEVFEFIPLGGPAFGGFAASQSGPIVVQTLQAGLTFALR